MFHSYKDSKVHATVGIIVGITANVTTRYRVFDPATGRIVYRTKPKEVLNGPLTAWGYLSRNLPFAEARADRRRVTAINNQRANMLNLDVQTQTFDDPGPSLLDERHEINNDDMPDLIDDYDSDEDDDYEVPETVRSTPQQQPKSSVNTPVRPTVRFESNNDDDEAVPDLIGYDSDDDEPSVPIRTHTSPVKFTSKPQEGASLSGGAILHPATPFKPSQSHSYDNPPTGSFNPDSKVAYEINC
jgi:hypothetical protein